MKQQRAPFQPVSADIDDQKLERLAAEKGVGSLVKPVADGAGEARSVYEPPRVKKSEAPNPEATPRSQMKTVNLEVPDYAWTELKIRAAREQVSVRHIVMEAMRAIGVAIKDADMVEDGRRIRGG
ncbi:MAG: hypothetical protein K2Y42_20400 [Hyphomicrobium sp.]|jgi:hypothetical protein|uniref:hypothetical protein n=1 Tax=Hyphomicrobium sp. TaxID=82 RepID=UPI0025B84EC5|nr:hypothetical protein [Hyphomicrobium sp.]MBX9865110.1 hypothetical protein [Hyphomicrobium sp.]